MLLHPKSVSPRLLDLFPIDHDAAASTRFDNPLDEQLNDLGVKLMLLFIQGLLVTGNGDFPNVTDARTEDLETVVAEATLRLALVVRRLAPLHVDLEAESRVNRVPIVIIPDAQLALFV